MDGDLRRRTKHLLRWKEAVWKRWSREYLRSLRERHRAKIRAGPVPKVEDVVTISDNEKKKGEWTLGIVEELVTGKDNEVRVAKIRSSKSHLERAVQQLYPLELSCDVEQPIPPVVMNPQAPVFRPRRDAAVAARERADTRRRKLTLARDIVFINLTFISSGHKWGECVGNLLL